MNYPADQSSTTWAENGMVSSEVRTLLHGYTYPLTIRAKDIEDGWRELGQFALRNAALDDAPSNPIELKLKVGALMAAYRDLDFSSDELIDWAINLDADTFRRVAMRHFRLTDPQATPGKQAPAAKAARRAAKRQSAAAGVKS